jgi:hypothetical protein
MFGGRRHRMFGWLRNRMFGRLRDRMSGGRWIRMPGGIWHGVFGRLRNRDVIREADVVLVIVGAASHIHTIRDTLANALCPHVLVVPVGEPVPIARRADGSHETIVHLVTRSLRPNQSQVVIAASPCGFVGNDLFDGAKPRPILRAELFRVPVTFCSGALPIRAHFSIRTNRSLPVVDLAVPPELSA